MQSMTCYVTCTYPGQKRPRLNLQVRSCFSSGKPYDRQCLPRDVDGICLSTDPRPPPRRHILPRHRDSDAGCVVWIWYFQPRQKNLFRGLPPFRPFLRAAAALAGDFESPPTLPMSDMAIFV